MTFPHAVVWLDHVRAVVIRFALDASEITEIHSRSPHRQIHRKSSVPGSGHAPDDTTFFAEVAGVLDGIPQILITGPGTAKGAFAKFVALRDPVLGECIVGTEPVDHPSTGELFAYARAYFRALDQRGGVRLV